MENPFIGKNGSKLWLVLLIITNILCFLLFSLDYSSLTNGTKIDIKVNSREQDLCWGRYIYIHDLPSQFNEDVLKNCQLLTRKTDKFDMCLFTNNSGFGPQVDIINSNYGVLSNTRRSWYFTNQFMLEVIFHNRMKKYECLTNDSSLASAIFVPFYAGLDLRRHLWGYKTSVRDASGFELVKWLAAEEKPEWKRMWGMDHFLVSGRISRDFRRQSDKNSEWGSKFRYLPESQNMSMLSIESSSSWNNNDFAIPYPTSFHPSTDSEVFQWQDRMRRQNRPYLFSFAGGARRSRNKSSIRDSIINQCLESNSSCKFLDCSSGTSNCDNPLSVMEVFEKSVFCLQPPGDSYTRRSTFDSILAGCIPVFFHPGSAYSQYVWHLPENHTKYSVFIPGKRLRDRNYRINETLVGVSKEEQEAMREQVIKLIPRIVYADPRSSSRFEDAFDLAVKGILGKIETFRRAIREVKITENSNFKTKG
ncbi:hypothetical protein ACOSQ2_006688 [Xanthoceras sorbifolium]|uniref:Exostosin GT47 domain-containing protein n=1 Tax=Xanthoceras sorbifolium TaxID=99658 RepID=A0ABQ8I8W5_9ROSI|nr:hypothetical protein JRO89_XS03G0048200 [Xanthoceras sorbifolium]